MILTIDLSEKSAAALEAQARAARMPAERYLAQVVDRALERQHIQDAANLAEHLDTMGAHVVAATTEQEMESALQEALMYVRPRRN